MMRISKEGFIMYSRIATPMRIRETPRVMVPTRRTVFCFAFSSRRSSRSSSARRFCS